MSAVERDSESRVTVGVPVYNGGRYFEEVLLSILNQSFKELRVIISDNASTDGTEALCREYARRDPRVQYYRQATNIGPEANFDFVLEQAETDYFMWAAADDVRSENYIETNVKFLDANSDYAASTCPTQFLGKSADPLLMGDESRAEDDPYERVLGMLSLRCANGRFYSLYRRSVIDGYKFFGKRFMASDLLFVATVLSRGKMHRVPEGFIALGQSGVSSSPRIYSVFKNHWVEAVAPFYFFSRGVLKIFRGATLRQRFKAYSFFIRLNIFAVIVKSIYAVGIYGLLKKIKRALSRSS